MASANIKEIKHRIRSIQSTMQITKAMELVSSSKLRRAKERVTEYYPYFNTLYQTMAHIAGESHVSDSVFIRPRPVRRSLFLVIAGDRGMAGSYNTNVLHLAAAEMKDKNPIVIAVGQKAAEYCAKASLEVLHSYPGIAHAMRIQDTHGIVNDIIGRFQRREFDEVYLCYTGYVSPIVQTANCLKLLPLAFGSNMHHGEKPHSLTVYDPSPDAVFASIVPEYLNGAIYGAVLESYASEQSARRMAMQTATDNAGAMIDKLRLSYNRARQTAITQEITEIISGSGLLGS